MACQGATQKPSQLLLLHVGVFFWMDAFSKTGFYCVTQAGIELSAILLTLSPECWNCGGWPKHLMVD